MENVRLGGDRAHLHEEQAGYIAAFALKQSESEHPLAHFQITGIGEPDEFLYVGSGGQQE
jgi:hypothetical protein